MREGGEDDDKAMVSVIQGMRSLGGRERDIESHEL